MRGFWQLALDFLDPTPLGAANTPPNSGQNKPPAIVEKARSATDLIATHGAEAAPSLASVLSPVSFMHPRANRQARLLQAQVGYELKRARRRSIGFVVGPDGLVVRAPTWVPLGQVDAALQEKADWIVRKLAEVQARQQRRDAVAIVWTDGVRFPLLGHTVRVQLDPGHGFAGKGAVLLRDGAACTLSQVFDVAPAQAQDAELVLQLALARTADQAQIRDAVQAWLMRQARGLFAERLDHFAARLQVRWLKLSLSNAGTRWGSARADGAIRLNWRLVHFKPAVLDYVVAHELSHLRVMDHSPRFWETVRSVVPEYASLRTQLRDEAVPRWA